jgi:outer membrane protein TolC
MRCLRLSSIPHPIHSAILAVACALAGTARGEDAPPYVPPPFLASPPALPPGSGDKVLQLDLAGAIEIALRQNLGIVVSRSQVELARLGVAQQIWSAYEPKLSLGYNHSASEQPPATLQAGQPGSVITQSSDGWNASVSQGLPTGGSVSASVNGGRVASSSGTAVEPLNHTTQASVQLNQPLLRGFSPDLVIPRASIITAKLNSEKARYDFESSAASLIQQTEAAYWRVVAALYAYGVEVKSQQYAAETAALLRRQVEAGIGLSSDLPGAEATLAQRQLDVLAAAAAIDQAWDELRTVLDLPRDQWTIPILPTERPRFEPGELPSAEVALDTAVHHRPELARAHLDLDLLRLQIREAENNALPGLNLSAGATSYGQGSTLGIAASQLAARSNTGWSVGLTLDLAPLGRANKVNAEMQRIQRQNQIISQDQLVQTIWNQVRTALRDQRAAALRVIQASKSRTLTGLSLEIENRKIASGTSSNLGNLAIAKVQNDLATAELAELGALLNHAQAATSLLLATGQLLDRRHIKVAVAQER